MLEIPNTLVTENNFVTSYIFIQKTPDTLDAIRAIVESSTTTWNLSDRQCGRLCKHISTPDLIGLTD